MKLIGTRLGCWIPMVAELIHDTLFRWVQPLIQDFRSPCTNCVNTLFTVHNHLTIFISNFGKCVEGYSSFAIIIFNWLWGDTPDDGQVGRQCWPNAVETNIISCDFFVSVRIYFFLKCEFVWTKLNSVSHIDDSLFRESFGMISLISLITGVILEWTMLPNSKVTMRTPLTMIILTELVKSTAMCAYIPLALIAFSNIVNLDNSLFDLCFCYLFWCSCPLYHSWVRGFGH